MSEEETREKIEEIINNDESIKEEIKEEVNEEIKEEEIPKTKAKSKSRAKPKQIKITKEPVVEEPVIEEAPQPVEPVIEEQPKKTYKLKQIVKCPDCKMDMTVHTLKYIHKRRGFCKADVKAEPQSSVPEPVPEQPKPKPKITEDIVNNYIKQNPDTVSNYLRNERSMKAQRKQMNARSLLNNVF